MRKLEISLFAAAVMGGALACDDGPVDKIENRARCREICDAVNECDSNYDQDQCTDTCADRSDDDNFEANAENCSKCIKRGDECTENVADCAAECTGVVVFSST